MNAELLTLVAGCSLGSSQKLLLLLLALRADEDGVACASYAQLVQLSGLGRTTVRSTLLELHATGLLAIESGGVSGEARTYRLCQLPTHLVSLTDTPSVAHRHKQVSLTDTPILVLPRASDEVKKRRVRARPVVGGDQLPTGVITPLGNVDSNVDLSDGAAVVAPLARHQLRVRDIEELRAEYEGKVRDFERSVLACRNHPNFGRSKNQRHYLEAWLKRDIDMEDRSNGRFGNRKRTNIASREETLADPFWASRIGDS